MRVKKSTGSKRVLVGFLIIFDPTNSKSYMVKINRGNIVIRTLIKSLYQDLDEWVLEAGEDRV